MRVSPYLHSVVVLALISLVTIGCGGKTGLSSPQVYGGENRQADENDSTAVSGSAQTSSEKPLRFASPKEATLGEGITDSSFSAITPDAASTPGDSNMYPPVSNSYDSLFYSSADSDDSASAVDDDIWRQFELAKEYHSMGVIANREAAWEEAQYYFEKALTILGALDIEVDSLATPEAQEYTTVLDNIVADYRLALRSLGHLDEDVSASVLIERFGDLANNLSLDTMKVYGEESKTITYDIPIVMNDRVRQSIVYFQTVADSAFAKYLSRLTKYGPMIKRILAEYGLPQDLVYLCLVESGFNPRAYSWARAAGLWQFIASTGRLYGLERDWWIDERRDPVKATHAAGRHLKDLYTEFGSWELAMAAYNCGPGKIRKTIERQRTMDFWKMSLKRQTMDYVPLIMAAAIIGKDPAKYGFDNIEYEEELIWDEVVIDRCLDLSVVAQEIGRTVEELKELNPELLRKSTPPNIKNYTLKIPAGTKERFILAYDSMPSPKETSWVRHTIKRGETVGSIAAKYGVSQYALLEANNLRSSSKIYAGHELIVPVPLDREYSASYSRGNRDYRAKNSIYVVRAGDTMWDIARAFGTSVDALRRVNYIERGSRIYVGQKLKIPAGATKLKEKDIDDSRSTATYAEVDKNEDPPSSGVSKQKTVRHKVRRGDTLWDIARQYGTTTARIRQLNGLDRSSRIYPGQILIVDDRGTNEYVIHQVRRGDTLSRIAREYRTTIALILANNDIPDPDQLQVGELLKIYLR
jgi:membrane-bound lytic murein transglycosylase D